jgi:hypothetical protein
MPYRLIVSVAAFLLTAPALAQDEGDGASRMERGAQDFLEGLMMEMEPVWRQMQEFMDAMGPALIDLMEEVRDWSVYEPPEVLDNGDIIIRRKPQEPEASPEPQIEL